MDDKFSLLKTLFEFPDVIYRLEQNFWVPGCPIKSSTIFTCSVNKKLGKVTVRLLKSLDLWVDQKVSTMNQIWKINYRCFGAGFHFFLDDFFFDKFHRRVRVLQSFHSFHFQILFWFKFRETAVYMGTTPGGRFEAGAQELNENFQWECRVAGRSCAL